MNSIDFILALILISTFGIFVISSENTIKEKTIQISEIQKENAENKSCMFILNSYYANAGGILEGKINCKKETIKKIPLLTEKVYITKGGKVSVKVEKHYL